MNTTPRRLPTATVALQQFIGPAGGSLLFLILALASNPQAAMLEASDGTTNEYFGNSVNQSGSSGLVGAYGDKIGTNSFQGSAYLFRNLDTATGTVTQTAKLTASDGAAGDNFGYSVSQSGSNGLIGAYRDKVGTNSFQGSAYLFRNLDTATGTVTQTAKLTASDGVASNYFGYSVSQSESSGLVGAYGNKIGTNASQGSAYLFRNLDTATGTVTQTAKLTASDGAATDYFGYSVSLDGDQFVIGAYRKNSVTGKAYTGSVSSITTLDAGSTSRTISGISFISQDDWIIGQTTDSNQVTLSAGDTANVTAAGKAVYIGKNAGSDNNTLVVAGTLTANQITVGAAGNTGNKLLISQSNVVADGAAITLSGGTITLSSGASETFGDLNLTQASSLDFGGGTGVNMTFGTYSPTYKLTINNFIGLSTLRFNGDLSDSINNSSLFSFANGFKSAIYDPGSNIFTITAIPEPSTCVAAAGLVGLMMWPVRRGFLRCTTSAAP